MKFDRKIYWQSLSERDKWMASIGGMITLVYGVYILIFSSLMHAVDAKSHEWVEKKETLTWMKSLSHYKRQPKHANRNLLSVFAKHLKTSSFSQFPYQLQQAGEGRIQLSFESVPYEDCVTWLKRLNEDYAFTTTELTVVRSKTSGLVKLRMVAAQEEKK